MRKNILFEDNHIIVVYKPAGIATQTARVGQQDMVSELKNYLAGKPEQKGKGVPYLALVHRLDQPVSGLLVFAKTKQGAADLSRQMGEGGFHKYYYALIYGRPAKEQGQLTAYLYKDGRTNRSMVVGEEFPGAKKAELSYRLLKTMMVLENGGEASLVEIRLFTGRHHQIRVQMAEAGMPLLGDGKYGTEAVRQFSREIGCRNVALCAYRLAFVHPVTKEPLCFEQLPREEIFAPFLFDSLSQR